MQIIKAARGNITGHFGDKNVPGANVESHGGMDIGHGTKTTADLRVVAPAAGRVVFAGKSGTYGLCIIIDHYNGYTSLLAHLAAVLVHAGFEVDQAQNIAVMGNSGGDWPVHLHQELRLHDVQLDPEKYLTSRPASSGAERITREEEDMAAATVIKETNGTLWYLPDDGDCIVLNNMDEFAALQATGALRVVCYDAKGKPCYIITPGDNFILNLRKGLAEKKRALVV